MHSHDAPSHSSELPSNPAPGDPPPPCQSPGHFWDLPQETFGRWCSLSTKTPRPAPHHSRPWGTEVALAQLDVLGPWCKAEKLPEASLSDAESVTNKDTAASTWGACSSATGFIRQGSSRWGCLAYRGCVGCLPRLGQDATVTVKLGTSPGGRGAAVWVPSTRPAQETLWGVGGSVVLSPPSIC